MPLKLAIQSRSFSPWVLAAFAGCLGICLKVPQIAKSAENPTIKADGSAAESSQNRELAIDSGRAVGEYVPTFYTRVVTGPLMNRSVCYVCRSGQRPVVMVFLRSLDEEFKPLLKEVDRLVDRHRAEGLRSFGIFVSEDPSEAVSPVQTFSFDHKIVLPLTVASNTIAEPYCQNLNAKADVTVVLYEKRRVVERFAFRKDQVKRRQIQEISDSINKLVAQSGNRGKSSAPAE